VAAKKLCSDGYSQSLEQKNAVAFEKKKKYSIEPRRCSLSQRLLEAVTFPYFQKMSLQTILRMRFSLRVLVRSYMREKTVKFSTHDPTCQQQHHISSHSEVAQNSLDDKKQQQPFSG
jgi:hypothetical protein